MSDLEKLEKVIEKGLKAFYDVGRALWMIRDNQLYKDEYTSFEEYVETRWGMVRSRAYQLIDSCWVYDILSTTVDILPTCEAQVRPLAKFPFPEQVEIVWSNAVILAGGKVPTANQVRQTVEEFASGGTIEPWEHVELGPREPGWPYEGDEVKWLNSAVSKDDARPALQGIHINNGKSYAADGFRLHIINTPEELKDKQGTFHASVYQSTPYSQGVGLEEINCEYPNAESIIPTNEPVFEVALNPEFLVDALRGMKFRAHLAFHPDQKGEGIIISVKSGDGFYPERQAIIMPMHMPERT